MAVTAGYRLGLDALDRVPADSRPLIRPGDIPVGIVHLGLGAFHRAHQAIYTEQAIAASGGDWGILGVAPRSAGVVRTLAEQDCLYSVTSLDGAGSRTKVIGALAGVLHAPADPGAAVARIADPAVRVVTLTVTEKAYQLDPATGAMRADAALLADLTTDCPPTTVPGLLVRGLAARARADAGPIALVSCDNLPANGRRLRNLVTHCLGTAAGIEPGTLEWVNAQVAFPVTMVDRIVPAATAATLAQAERALGVADGAALAAEPFLQWVIEDEFPGGRPAWEMAGAIITSDAAPWEHLKLRALNGVHSALAYLGALAGVETIAGALELPGMREVLGRLIAEDVAPSLAAPRGVSVTGYGDAVLTRFANPAIGHRTLQVAMDGSQKLPQRILHAILDRRDAGAAPRWAALVVAAWMRFVTGRSDDGRQLPLDDPLAASIRAALRRAGGEPGAIVAALLALEAIFPARLAADSTMRALVTGWLVDLTRHGVRATLAAAATA